MGAKGMREVISGKLWIGNACDLRDVSALYSCGIAAVVDLAIEEPTFQSPRDIVYCRFPLLDGEGNSQSLLRTAVETVSAFIERQTPVLVGCSGGMSRSPAIVAAALARSKQQSPVECLNQIAATGPHDVSPTLWNEICESIMPSVTASTDQPRLKLVVVRSANLERTAEFFTILGMKFQNEKHGTGPVHLSAECNDFVFEIYPAKSLEDIDRTTRLGFAVNDPVAVIAEVKSRGFLVVEALKRSNWGMRAVVRDPDDRSIEVYAATSDNAAG
jgi:hypothetical protein